LITSRDKLRMMGVEFDQAMSRLRERGSTELADEVEADTVLAAQYGAGVYLACVAEGNLKLPGMIATVGQLIRCTEIVVRGMAAEAERCIGDSRFTGEEVAHMLDGMQAIRGMQDALAQHVAQQVRFRECLDRVVKTTGFQVGGILAKAEDIIDADPRMQAARAEMRAEAAAAQAAQAAHQEQAACVA